MRPIHLGATAFCAGLIGLAAPLAAQQPTNELGILTCAMQISVGAESTGPAATGGETLNVLCTFKPRKGAEESYSGTMHTVSRTPDRPADAAMLWVVKGEAQTALTPGLLQQSFAADPATPPEQMPPAMVGQLRSDVLLQPMADKQVGAVGAGLIVITVELTLSAASG